MFKVKTRIKDRIFVYTSCVSIIFLFFFTSAAFYIIRHYRIKTALFYVSSASKNAERKINLFFNDIFYLIKDFSSKISKNKLSENRIKKLFASALRKENAGIISIYFASSNGKFITEGIQKNEKTFLHKNYTSRLSPWYKLALKKGSVVITKPYAFAKTNEYGIRVLVPVKKQGTVIGVLAIDLSLLTITAMINTLKNTLKGEVFIIDKDLKQILGKSKINCQYFSNFFKKAGIKLENSVYRYGIIKINTDKYVSSYVKNSLTNWIIIVSIPYKMTMETSLPITITAVIFFLILSSSIVLTAYFSLSILTKPVEILASAAREIKQGNFDYKITEKSKTEFGLLFQTYNQMSDEIKNFTEALKTEKANLDSEVKARTENLLKAKNELERLNDITKEIGKSLEYDAVLDKTVSYLYVLYGFEGGALILLDEHKERYLFDRVLGQDNFNERIKTLQGKHKDTNEIEGLISDCIKFNKIEYIKDFSLFENPSNDDKEFFLNNNVKSSVLIPFGVDKETLGLLILTSHVRNVRLSDDDISSIKRFVNQIAITVKNSKLYEDVKATKNELEKKDKIISEELYLAKNMQTNLLSFNKDNFKNIDISVFYKPMIEVGGDTYDFYAIDENRYRIFLADATGHGIHAALTTMLIKSEYHKIKILDLEPDKILELLNSVFIRNYESINLFFTCVILDIDFNKHELSFSSAGHPYQFFIKNNDIIHLEAGGKLIGLDEESGYLIQKLKIDKGDKIILFTDGIYEVFSEKEELYNIFRLEHDVKTSINLKPGEIIQNTNSCVKSWTGSGDILDDITLIGIELLS